jgi:thioredoxin
VSNPLITVVVVLLAMGLYLVTRPRAEWRPVKRHLVPALVWGLGGFVVATFLVGGTSGPVAWSEDITRVDSGEHFDALVAASDETPLLVDFYADWCSPCHMSAPKLNALAAEGHTVAVVDADLLQGIVRRNQVPGYPTLVIFKDGREAARLIGVHSREEILAALQELTC